MNQADYVRAVLTAYRHTPTTSGRVHRQDRLMAAELFRRGVPLTVAENALVLGASRRLYRDLNAPPLTPVRSLNYFSSIIEEVLTLKISPGYFDYLRYKIQHFDQAKQRFLASQKTEISE